MLTATAATVTAVTTAVVISPKKAASSLDLVVVEFIMTTRPPRQQHLDGIGLLPLRIDGCVRLGGRWGGGGLDRLHFV